MAGVSRDIGESPEFAPALFLSYVDSTQWDIMIKISSYCTDQCSDRETRSENNGALLP